MRGATVLAAPLKALLAACEKMGIEASTLFEAASVSASALDDPSARLSLEEAARMWAVALQLTEEPLIGLQAAQALPPGAYRVLDYLVANSPTVRAAYHRVSDYSRIIDSACSIEISEGPDEVVCAMRHALFPAGLPRPYVECNFAVVALRSNVLWGFGFEALRRGG